MTRGSELGTGISRAQSSGTALKPTLRAATAGNSASRSSVSVKMQLTQSCGSRSLRFMISRRSHSVAPRIASASFWSTVVAPRRAWSRIAASSLTTQALHLGGGQPAVSAGLEPLELQRAERDPREFDPPVADGVPHAADLAFAALAQRDLEHARLRLHHLGGQRLTVVELD